MALLDLVLSPADADDQETTYRRIVANRAAEFSKQTFFIQVKTRADGVAGTTA
ncbi:hypothetical protein MPLB_840021 [Mesorhizobium sp. ORS 3324]|nr:hypothetical protein MPLB_840021 [Mesorhizobium sp. ORS 3324]